MADRGERLVAIESGSDWADASVKYLVAPAGVDVDELIRQCTDTPLGTRPPSLMALLMDKGAREATLEDIVVFQED